MKKTLTVILMIYILSNLFFPGVMNGQTRGEKRNSGDFTGLFVLQEASPFRVSIDHGWGRDGWIPVFFTFRDLEIAVRVKAGDLDTGEGLTNRINELLVEDMNLPFMVYEQNHMRTRMELLEDRSVQLKINPNGRVEIFVGGSRLKLEPNFLHADFAEIESAPGMLFQLTFMGKKFSTDKGLVFMPSRGIIYVASPGGAFHDLNNDPGKISDWRVWAVRSESETDKAGRMINEDQVK